MNTSRLRADIDAGRTGDKTPGEDPAAAPLGTDEEAAGTPIDPALAESVRQAERRPDGDALSRQNATPGAEDARISHQSTRRPLAIVVWIAAGLSVAVALLWAMAR